MKREILFRGKRVDNGEWVYGYLLQGDPCIIVVYGIGYSNNYSEFKVIPETVGQFTGLTDKNGTKIFEGDILNLKLDICFKSGLSTVNGWQWESIRHQQED